MSSALAPDRVARDGARESQAIRLALFTDTYPPQINGVSRTLDRLANAVCDRGGDARVYTTTDPQAADFDAMVWRRPSIPFWAYPQLRIAAPVRGAAYRDLRAWRPTLVHAATPFGMGLAGRACARTLDVPMVTSYHTSFSEYAKFYRLGALSALGWSFFRWFHNSGARTYVPTHAVRTELEGYGFQRLAIWGRGIETHRFSPRFRSAVWRERLGADDRTVVAAYVGRLAAEKGLDVALGAMHRLQAFAATDAAPRIVFGLAGDGPYAEYCRRTAPPPPSVHFVGRLTDGDLQDFYASADLFVFPSTTDTFGNVLLEAMASGLPVIGADVGPTRELLAAGGGVTFPPGDADSLASTIHRLAADPALRRSLADRGQAFAASCSWDRIFDELVTDYQRVVAATAPR
jgi:phosphatidylinositol alpha 1,6-mannosyltransferase